jgi:hypothetical protein
MTGFPAVEAESANIVFAGGGGDVWAGHETTIPGPYVPAGEFCGFAFG